MTMGVELFQRGKVYWVAIHRLGQKRVRRSLKTRQKTVAKRMAKEIDRRLTAGDFGILGTSSPSVRVFAAQRMEAWERRLRKTTLHGYRLGLAAALPLIGDRRVSEVTRADAIRVAEVLRTSPSGRERAYASLRNILAPLQSLFGDAIEAGLIQANPFAAKAKLLRQVVTVSHDPDDHAGDVFPYTREEQRRLLAAIEDLEDRAAVLVALRAGLRRGEVLALRRPNVDFDARMIRVRERWAMRENEIPKSRTSRRDVPMTFELERALRAVIAAQDARAAKRGRPAPELLFPAKAKRTAATQHQEENAFGRRFARTLAAAGIERRSPNPFHQLRHTFASELLARGVDIWTVSRWLGHSSIELTNKVYAHWIPKDAHHAEMQRLDADLSLAVAPQNATVYATVDGERGPNADAST